MTLETITRLVTIAKEWKFGPNKRAQRNYLQNGGVVY